MIRRLLWEIKPYGWWFLLLLMAYGALLGSAGMTCYEHYNDSQARDSTVFYFIFLAAYIGWTRRAKDKA